MPERPQIDALLRLGEEFSHIAERDHRALRADHEGRSRSRSPRERFKARRRGPHGLFVTVLVAAGVGGGGTAVTQLLGGGSTNARPSGSVLVVR